MKPVQFIEVRHNGQTIGNLSLGSDGLARFEYAAAWLGNGFSVSPYFLPLQAGLFKAKPDPFGGMFGVFADSMPDGWGNLLLDRFLMRNGIKPNTLTVLDRLSFVGTHGMGAL